MGQRLIWNDATVHSKLTLANYGLVLNRVMAPSTFDGCWNDNKKDFKEKAVSNLANGAQKVEQRECFSDLRLAKELLTNL